MSAALRARPADLLERFPLRPVANQGELEVRDVDVLGHSALLRVERVSAGRVRATVAVRVARGQFGQALALGREVAAEAHRIGKEAVERYGRAETAAIWGVGFTVEGSER